MEINSGKGNDGINFFNESPENYIEKLKKPFWSLCDELLHSMLLDFLHKRFRKDDSFSVLDIGCGTGKWSQKIQHEFPHARFTLIDGSESMLLLARSNLTNNATFYQTDLNTPKILRQIRSQQFDVILDIYVSMFLNTKSPFLTHFSSLLKENGILFYVVQNKLQVQRLLMLEGNLSDLKSIDKNKPVSTFKGYPPMHYWNYKELVSDLSDLSISYVQTFPNFAVNGIREKLTKAHRSISDTIRLSGLTPILTFEKQQLKHNFFSSGMYWFVIAENIN